MDQLKYNFIVSRDNRVLGMVTVTQETAELLRGEGYEVLPA